MAHVQIPDEMREVEYLSQTGTGPFAFTYDWFQKSDIQVFVDDVQMDEADWSVTPTETLVGGFRGGSVTLNTPVANADIIIALKTRPGRETDFASGGAKPQDVNSALDKLHAIVRDLHTLVDRTPQFRPRDPVSGPIFFPRPAERADKFIKFSSDGLSLALVSAANIDALASIANELNALTGLVSEIEALGDPAVIADMAQLGDADVIIDMDALANASVLDAMAAIKADIDLGANSHILNALPNATTASNSAATATQKAGEASLDARSVALSEDSIRDLLAAFNIFDGGPFATPAAAVSAGATLGQVVWGTGDLFYRITAVTPTPTWLQVSPLTAGQSANLDEVPSLVTFRDNANLQALSGLTGAADKAIHFTGAGALAVHDQTAFGRSLANQADPAALRATAGLVIGTHVQAHDADLSAIAALTTTPFGRSLLELADANAAQALIGANVHLDAASTKTTLSTTASVVLNVKNGWVLLWATYRDDDAFHLEIRKGSPSGTLLATTDIGGAPRSGRYYLAAVDTAPGVNAFQGYWAVCDGSGGDLVNELDFFAVTVGSG